MQEAEPRERIKKQQLSSLRNLMQSLVGENAFYSPRLIDAGFANGCDSIADFCSCFPLTTKAEIVEDQQRFPPFGSNLTYPVERYTRLSQTSGTSGQSIRWADTPESWQWMVDCWCAVLRKSDVGPGDRIFYAFSFGPFLGFWTAFNAGERIGAMCIPGGGMSTLARIKAIIDNQATVVCCTPTYAIHLGEIAKSNQIDLASAKVKTIIVAGEAGAGIPATRALIEDYWPGARLWDHHGMTEIGPVTYECSRNPGLLHVLEADYIAEVIDPKTGTAVHPGSSGELVLTNLGRVGSPLLRYRTGDLVCLSAEERCTCGTLDMGLIGGIIGRTDDMVVIRGINVWPSSIEAVIRTFTDIVEFRMTSRRVNAMAELEVEIELKSEHSDPLGLCTRVEAALRAAITLRIPVTPVQEGVLPRWEHKAKRWISLDTP